LSSTILTEKSCFGFGHRIGLKDSKLQVYELITFKNLIK